MLRLEMLPADYGDCLWLEYGEGRAVHRVLIDGGPGTGPGGTYQTSIRPRIAALGRGTPKFELLVVTHIDNDHILGALELLRDGSLDFRVGEVWFNGWDQIVERDLQGVKEGVALGRAIKDRGFAHNRSFGGGAAMTPDAGRPQIIRLADGLELTILSPGPKQVRRLRDEWESVVAEAAGEREGQADVLGKKTPDAADVARLADKPFKADNAPANGSSIVLLAEYAGRRLLLAADSFAPVVADSLRRLGHTPANRLQLDAYKMAHHGSHGNNSNDVLDLVRCRNYLFSTSGARFHHPHPECVARVLVHGGKNVRFHSNYRRGPDMLWSRRAVMDKYGHEVIEPPAGREGLVVELP